jgi:spore coat polysaccharide biosynthesis protein SpsF
MTVPAFISVRSTSTRLPGKCMLPFGDCNVLEHVIRRVKHYALDAIVCTTDEKADDCIVAIAETENARCFRGIAINRLKRWADCCAAFGLDAFHTVDADDLFFDGEQVKQSFVLLKGGDWDMVTPSESSAAGGASVGVSMTKNLAERAVEKTSKTDDTEIIWSWIDRLDGVKKTVLPESDPDPVRVRLTLDFEEDYWLMISILRMTGPLASRRDIDNLLRRNPDLYKINWFRNQEWADAQERKKA